MPPSFVPLTPKRVSVPGWTARSAILIAGPPGPSVIVPTLESRAPFAGLIVTNLLVMTGGGGGKPPAGSVEPKSLPVESKASPDNLSTPFGWPTSVTVAFV